MRAIVSVSDRAGIAELVRGLLALGAEVFATDGTRAYLADAGLAVESIGELTDFPEILGGRVKTLHPAVHGGILARRDVPEQLAELAEHGIGAIDLVAVNLYPFAQTVSQPNASLQEALENIDIGGPTMLRAAAKNFASVIVLADPADYQPVLDQLAAGAVTPDTRRRLAAKAFAHCAAYDAYIAAYLKPPEELFPPRLTITMEKVQDLRYGENPHQQAAFYRDPLLSGGAAGVAGGLQLHGIKLSFCNTLDVDAAWACVNEFSAPAVAIIKHTNPCGMACAQELLDAYRRAHSADPISAFGGAVGLNREVDEATAQEMAQTFYEDIVAPGYSNAALRILTQKRNLRIFQATPGPATGPFAPYPRLDLKRVSGGFLVQSSDDHPLDDEPLKCVTERKPTLNELTDLKFAWRVVKHVKSNAIVLARELATVGIGAGQMSRVDAVELALRKAGERAVRSVLASDAFFPFPDGVQIAAKGGVTAITQPGGSIRDEEIIRVANKHHMAMLFTGYRHFKH